jgi:hypothetical protein
VETAPSLRANNFHREVDDNWRRSCVNNVSDPPIPASLHTLSGTSEAFPVERGRARGVEHRIGQRRVEKAFEARD